MAMKEHGLAAGQRRAQSCDLAETTDPLKFCVMILTSRGGESGSGWKVMGLRYHSSSAGMVGSWCTAVAGASFEGPGVLLAADSGVLDAVDMAGRRERRGERGTVAVLGQRNSDRTGVRTPPCKSSYSTQVLYSSCVLDILHV